MTHTPARRSDLAVLQITESAFHRLPPRVRHLLQLYGRERLHARRGALHVIEMASYRVAELEQALAEDLAGAACCPACKLPLLPGELEQRRYLGGHCRDCAADATPLKMKES